MNEIIKMLEEFKVSSPRNNDNCELPPQLPSSFSSPPSSSSNAKATAGSVTTPLDEKDLQILSSKNAAKVKYPPGCPVWYDLANLSSKWLDARSGVVTSVHMDFETGALVYELLRNTLEEEKDQGGKSLFVWQDQLAYAMNCPVLVKDTLEHINSDPEKTVEVDKIEGIIVCPRRNPGGDHRKLSYSVLFTEGNRLGMESDVETERISFRKLQNSSISNEGMLKERQQSSRAAEHRTKAVAELGVKTERIPHRTELEEGIVETEELKLGEQNTVISKVTVVENNAEKEQILAGTELEEGIVETEELKVGEQNTVIGKVTVVENNMEKEQILAGGGEQPNSKDQNESLSYKPDANNSRLSIPSSESTSDEPNDVNDNPEQTQDEQDTPEEENRTLIEADTSEDNNVHKTDAPDEGRKPDDDVPGEITFQTPDSAPKCSNYEFIGDLKLNDDMHDNNDHRASPSPPPKESEQPSNVEYPQVPSVMPAVVSTEANSRKLPSSGKQPLPNSAVSDTTTLRSDNRNGSVTSGRKACDPPVQSLSGDSSGGSSRQQQKVSCRLTVPSWVTESTNRNLYYHLVGKDENGKQGHHKLRAIKRETGCTVRVTGEAALNISVKTVPPSSHERSRFDKAREMIEDSVLEFVECKGARARLLSVLAWYLDDGTPFRLQVTKSGAVRQRDPTSNELVWMKLLDLPTTLFQKGRLRSFRDDLQLRVGLRHRVRPEATPWSAEVFGHELDNMTTPLQFCKPFVLVCSPGMRDNAGMATRSVCPLKDAMELVWNTVDEYHRRHQRVTLKAQRFIVNLKKSVEQRRGKIEPHAKEKERACADPHSRNKERASTEPQGDEVGSEGVGPGLVMGSRPGRHFVAYGLAS